MYDELEGLARQFRKDIERAEAVILKGGEAISDLTAYKVKCAELRIWRQALSSVEEVRKGTLKEEFAVDG